MKFDARRTPRLRLKRSAPATTRLGAVEIIDVTPPGLGISHDFKIERTAVITLEFTWGGKPLELECEIRSTREVSPGKYRSGLSIFGGPSAVEFRKLVEREIEKMKAAQVQRPSVV